jgi:hypothetical protein
MDFRSTQLLLRLYAENGARALSVSHNRFASGRYAGSTVTRFDPAASCRTCGPRWQVEVSYMRTGKAVTRAPGIAGQGAGAAEAL